mgnify:FL=1
MYRLPIISGVLLTLAFFPFYLSPLAFVALAPLFYFVANPLYFRREIFIGGCLVGAIGVGPLIYFSLAQLTLFPDALLFTYLVRASSIPALLLIATLFGGAVVVYHMLRSSSILLNSLVGASVYLIVEVILFFISGGYYYGSLAHAVVGFPPARVFAALGGASLVSFLIAWAAALAAEVVYVWKERPRAALRPAAFSILFLCAVYAGLSVYLYPTNSAAREPALLRVAVLQLAPRAAGEIPFGEEAEGEFVNPMLAFQLAHAAQEADLLIYPFSPFSGIVSPSTDRAIGVFLAKTVPTSTTVVVWNTIAEGGALYDELAFWKNGVKSSYRKQKLYALSDYAPWWSFGLARSTFAISPGGQSEVLVAGTPVGGLICSELHQPAFARQKVRESALLLAVGSDTMFPGDFSGNFSLAAAQYRAAENGVSVIRGNLLGPSAIIRQNGSVDHLLVYGTSGVVGGSVSLHATRDTPYRLFGPWPLYALVAGILCLALLRRLNSKFLRMSAQR